MLLPELEQKIRLRVIVTMTAALGVYLSAYTYYISYRLVNEPDFQPACDFNAAINCTKSIRLQPKPEFGFSSYFSIFRQPDAFYSLVYFAFIIGSSFVTEYRKLAYYVIHFANLMSAYYSYRSIVTFKTICLVCFCHYVLNIILLFAIRSEAKLRPKLRYRK